VTGAPEPHQAIYGEATERRRRPQIVPRPQPATEQYDNITAAGVADAPDLYSSLPPRIAADISHYDTPSNILASSAAAATMAGGTTVVETNPDDINQPASPPLTLAANEVGDGQEEAADTWDQAVVLAAAGIDVYQNLPGGVLPAGAVPDELLLPEGDDPVYANLPGGIVPAGAILDDSAGPGQQQQQQPTTAANVGAKTITDQAHSAVITGLCRDPQPESSCQGQQAGVRAAAAVTGAVSSSSES